jgi:hypothetical protein
MNTTDSMEPTASSEPVIAYLETLYLPNVHYSTHKSPPLGPILNQMRMQPTLLHRVSSGPILILSSYLRIGFQTSPFHSSFPTKISCAFLVSHIHDKCPYRLIHELIILIWNTSIWRRVQITKLLIIQFSPVLVSSFLFSPDILLITLLSDTNLCSSLKARDQVSLPYKTTDKINFCIC